MAGGFPYLCRSTWFRYLDMLMPIITAFGRLELECCERKILLPGWWLEAGAGGMWETNTIALKDKPPAEHSAQLLARCCCKVSWTWRQALQFYSEHSPRIQKPLTHSGMDPSRHDDTSDQKYSDIFYARAGKLQIAESFAGWGGRGKRLVNRASRVKTN